MSHLQCDKSTFFTISPYCLSFPSPLHIYCISCYISSSLPSLPRKTSSRRIVEALHQNDLYHQLNGVQVLNVNLLRVFIGSYHLSCLPPSPVACADSATCLHFHHHCACVSTVLRPVSTTKQGANSMTSHSSGLSSQPILNVVLVAPDL